MIIRIGETEQTKTLDNLTMEDVYEIKFITDQLINNLSIFVDELIRLKKNKSTRRDAIIALSKQIYQRNIINDQDPEDIIEIKTHRMFREMFDGFNRMRKKFNIS